ncbi:hypothetical protein COCSADRAFT_163993 [Bipolaris sorokiniana ND90Pr]|uniref:Uncharacterized protein n=1 Tax=Cochliobolus sativus (strain ND90Pr / ATCC 201652) TaxID=665912 RepID=M2S0B8_COCSN|nr:uncharacterized protein COCSADRAFT_163993 [Bipolaris sorokiniana ND90Pr]EMD60698.1 hypothetical protein COCSADRAFT_163993 [Bipolaris sorokiniana ND90Pr]
MRKELKRVILDAEALLEASGGCGSTGATGAAKVNRPAKGADSADATGSRQRGGVLRVAMFTGSPSSASSYASAGSTASVGLFTPTDSLESMSSPLYAESSVSLEKNTL